MKILTTILVLVSLITSCSAPKKELTGFLVLIDYESVSGSWDNCEGTGGYSDVSQGANVSIENEDGKIITGTSWRNLDEKAVSILAEEKIVSSEADTVSKVKQELSNSEGFLCVLYFQAKIKKGSANVYQIKAGRGEQTYTKQQLKEKDYIITLSLGN